MLRPFFTQHRTALWAGLMALSLCTTAHANRGGIALNQTRVVFQETDKNAALTMTNSGQSPFLVKASVLDHVQSDTSSANPPFVMTPPLFRLEADNQHTLLVVKQGQVPLPTDRESVFYLSLLAIPASAPMEDSQDDAVAAKVSVGIRTTIKLFYRPKGLGMKVHEAPQALTFAATAEGITVTNPTPYYLTLAQLTVNAKPVELVHATAMVAPFSTQAYATGDTHLNAVTWQVINDYGGASRTYQASEAALSGGKS